MANSGIRAFSKLRERWRLTFHKVGGEDDGAPLLVEADQLPELESVEGVESGRRLVQDDDL